MRIDILTIFPQAFDLLTASKIFARGKQANKFEFFVHDLRTFATDKHRTVDDEPFGGGAGMVMKAEPLVNAIEAVTQPDKKVQRVYLTPKGRTWSHSEARAYLDFDQVILLCGRYQGIDQRVIEGWIDDEISIGDFILSGGEIPALVVTETIVRLIPGVLGNEDSLMGETFENGLTEWPLYTRPRNFRGKSAPQVLLSGDHQAIAKWRSAQKTKK
jgi:tRNA (guanine37-N1)-methyltransferase